jgi:hypothetical protein
MTAIRLAVPAMTTGGRVYLGGTRGAATAPWGWRWVDGTNYSNIDCGTMGCGIFPSTAPR